MLFRSDERMGPVIQYFLGDEIRLEPIVEICVEEEPGKDFVIKLYTDYKVRKEVKVDELDQVA